MEEVQSKVVWHLHYMCRVLKRVMLEKLMQSEVTTGCIREGERDRGKERERDLSNSLPDGNSLQEHKEETSGNTLPWKEDNYSMIQKWPFQKEKRRMHHNC